MPVRQLCNYGSIEPSAWHAKQVLCLSQVTLPALLLWLTYSAHIKIISDLYEHVFCASSGAKVLELVVAGKSSLKKCILLTSFCKHLANIKPLVSV